MRRLAKKGIALQFAMGLVLTVAMLITALWIFADIFSYESEAKGYESFVRLVAMMHEVDREPEGTRDSVLVRLPSDWAILGFDSTPLEAVRMLPNGMVVLRRAYRPDTPECGAGSRCVCLVKNFDVAQTMYWERTLRCVNLDEEGEDLLISHYTNVGTEEYTIAGRTMRPSFIWKGGFAIVEDEDSWSGIWREFPGVDISNEQAASTVGAVFVEKAAEGRIAVCTNRGTCISDRSEEMHRQRNRAIEQYLDLERRSQELMTHREQSLRAGVRDPETEALRDDFRSLMQEYDTFLASRSFIHLSQYQQDVVYTKRHRTAKYGEVWDRAIQYTDEALLVVQDENMRLAAETEKNLFDCEGRTLNQCQAYPPVCTWERDECERLQSIRIPDVDCGSRENEGDCLFEHPRLCRWSMTAIGAVIGDRCERVPEIPTTSSRIPTIS